jgi:hypothetical protein
MTAAEIRPRSPTRRGGQLCRPRVQRCADQLVMALAPCLARRTGADRATACVEVPHPAVMSCKLLIVANLAKLRPVIRRTTSGTSNCRANGSRTNRSSALGPPRHTERACAGAERTRAADDPGGLAAQAVPATADTSPACDAAPGLPYLPHRLRSAAIRPRLSRPAKDLYPERTWCPPRQPPPAASPGRCGRPLGVAAAACWCSGLGCPAVYA